MNKVQLSGVLLVLNFYTILNILYLLKDMGFFLPSIVFLAYSLFIKNICRKYNRYMCISLSMCHPVMHPALEELIAFNRVSEGNIFIKVSQWAPELFFFKRRRGMCNVENCVSIFEGV